jgi:hypothetical protein
MSDAEAPLPCSNTRAARAAAAAAQPRRKQGARRKRLPASGLLPAASSPKLQEAKLGSKLQALRAPSSKLLSSNGQWDTRHQPSSENQEARSAFAFLLLLLASCFCFLLLVLVLVAGFALILIRSRSRAPSTRCPALLAARCPLLAALRAQSRLFGFEMDFD